MRETNNLEFKREPSRSFLKTVSAFANYGNGTILFGVEDDGCHMGIARPQETCLEIEHAINDSLNPVPDFRLTINENTKVIELTVNEGPDKPYLYKGKAYRRADSSTVEVDRLEYNRLVRRGMNLSYDSLESAEQHLTFTTLERELVEKAGLLTLDENALISLELMTPARTFNNAASLLSDQDSAFGLDIARFGESISIILSRYELHQMSVLDQLDRAMEILQEHYDYEEIVGADRVLKHRVPPQAFREAVANALVHRRWDIEAHIKISMFPDRIEIVSPGGLPEGITADEYLAGGPSVLRNPILANVFFRLGYIERFGTGIPRIIEEYSTLDVSPSFDVKASSIVVSLPAADSLSVSDEERALLGLFPKGSSFSRAEAEKALGISKDKTIRLLNTLLEKKALSKGGAGRSVVYTRK